MLHMTIVRFAPLAAERSLGMRQAIGEGCMFIHLWENRPVLHADACMGIFTSAVNMVKA